MLNNLKSIVVLRGRAIRQLKSYVFADLSIDKVCSICIAVQGPNIYFGSKSGEIVLKKKRLNSFSRKSSCN